MRACHQIGKKSEEKCPLSMTARQECISSLFLSTCQGFKSKLREFILHLQSTLHTVYTVKKVVAIFPSPGQALPGRVWLVTSLLGQENKEPFFTVYHQTSQNVHICVQNCTYSGLQLILSMQTCLAFIIFACYCPFMQLCFLYHLARVTCTKTRASAAAPTSWDAGLWRPLRRADLWRANGRTVHLQWVR